VIEVEGRVQILNVTNQTLKILEEGLKELGARYKYSAECHDLYFKPNDCTCKCCEINYPSHRDRLHKITQQEKTFTYCVRETKKFPKHFSTGKYGVRVALETIEKKEMEPENFGELIKKGEAKKLVEVKGERSFFSQGNYILHRQS
jgi:hypothetical protein